MKEQEPQINQNNTGVMERLRESRLALAAATVGSFVAMELGINTHQVGGAPQPEAHAARAKTGMNPGAVMNSIVKIHDQNNWNEVRAEDYMNIRSTSVIGEGYAIRGGCSKKIGGHEPYTKAFVVVGDKETMYNCKNNKKSVGSVDRDRPAGFYQKQTTNISKRMVRSVRLPSQVVGTAISVKANRSVAVAEFQKLPVESSGTSFSNKSLKKLIIRKNKKPTKIFYKPAQ